MERRRRPTQTHVLMRNVVIVSSILSSAINLIVLAISATAGKLWNETSCFYINCRLLVTFANILNPDQNCHADGTFEIILEHKEIVEKITPCRRQKHAKSPWIIWENGSVVECLTRDRRAAGSSLTGVTALWSLSKTHLS